MRSMGYEPRQSEIDEMITQMQKNEAARAVSSGMLVCVLKLLRSYV